MESTVASAYRSLGDMPSGSRSKTPGPEVKGAKPPEAENKHNKSKHASVIKYTNIKTTQKTKARFGRLLRLETERVYSGQSR